MNIREFRTTDQASVIALWEQCELVKAWNNPAKDIQRKIDDSAQGFFVGTEDQTIIASIMVGYDGHRGWVNYLAVAPTHRGLGLGRDLMKHAEKVLLSQGCPKLNLQVRTSNAEVIRFYNAIGYKEDACISFGKRLIPDD